MIHLKCWMSDDAPEPVVLVRLHWGVYDGDVDQRDGRAVRQGAVSIATPGIEVHRDLKEANYLSKHYSNESLLKFVYSFLSEY